MEARETIHSGRCKDLGLENCAYLIEEIREEQWLGRDDENVGLFWI